MGTVGGTAGTQQARERGLERLYRQDPYSRARAQAEALRRRDPEAIGWKHLADEIEDLAREAASRPKRRYRTMMQHFPQRQYGEGRDTGLVVEWETAAGNARMEIGLLPQDCPGLEGERHRLFQEAWELGREKAVLVFAHQAVTPIRNAEARWRGHKRLRREWRRLLPQKHPCTLRRAEAKFWRPAPTRLANRPQSGEPAVRAASNTP